MWTNSGSRASRRHSAECKKKLHEPLAKGAGILEGISGGAFYKGAVQDVRQYVAACSCSKMQEGIEQEEWLEWVIHSD